MPNPRVTFRCPEDLYGKLPVDDRERSLLILHLLTDYYNPKNPADRIARLEQRVADLEARVEVKSSGRTV